VNNNKQKYQVNVFTFSTFEINILTSSGALEFWITLHDLIINCLSVGVKAPIIIICSKKKDLPVYCLITSSSSLERVEYDWIVSCRRITNPICVEKSIILEVPYHKTAFSIDLLFLKFHQKLLTLLVKMTFLRNLVRTYSFYFPLSNFFLRFLSNATSRNTSNRVIC